MTGDLTRHLRQAEADLGLARRAVNRARANASVPFRDILLNTAEAISRTEELLATVRRIDPVHRELRVVPK